MTKPELYAVLVLYNKHYCDSDSFRSLKERTDLHLILCDNSTKPLGNEKVTEEYPQVTYLSMKGNAGLSKAYNAAIDSLQGKKGLLILFDDDTEIGDAYFSDLLAAVEKTPADIYLPTVYDELGLMSPNHIYGVRNKRLRDLEELDMSLITGINSAMAIDLRVFEHYRYNEAYFLDNVDHAFLRDMKAQKRKIVVFNTDLHQHFSYNDCMNIDAARFRFKIFRKDYWTFCDNNLHDRLFCILVLIKRWIRINCYMPFYRLTHKG